MAREASSMVRYIVDQSPTKASAPRLLERLLVQVGQALAQLHEPRRHRHLVGPGLAGGTNDGS